MALRRGFKTEAERKAKEIWDDFELAPSNSMDAVALSRHLGYFVRSADELVSRNKLKQLDEIQRGAFSACTLSLPEGNYSIVYNPLCSVARRNSDVAHELSHLLLGHRLSKIQYVSNVAFVSCDAGQEAEASWLAGCLLLPRFVLLHELKRKATAARIADRRNLSEDIVRYRINVTGVSRQLRARRK